MALNEKSIANCEVFWYPYHEMCGFMSLLKWTVEFVTANLFPSPFKWFWCSVGGCCFRAVLHAAVVSSSFPKRKCIYC